MLWQVLLFEALKANRCDYVKVLLDRHVVLDDHYLDELYLQVCEKMFNCNLFLLLKLIVDSYQYEFTFRLSYALNVVFSHSIVRTLSGILR